MNNVKDNADIVAYLKLIYNFRNLQHATDEAVTIFGISSDTAFRIALELRNNKLILMDDAGNSLWVEDIDTKEIKEIYTSMNFREGDTLTLDSRPNKYKVIVMNNMR